LNDDDHTVDKANGGLLAQNNDNDNNNDANNDKRTTKTTSLLQ